MLTLAIVLATLLSTVTSSQSCHTTSANLYITAIYAKNPQAAAAIPLDPHVHRFEGPPGFAIETAYDAPSLRESTYAGPSAAFLTGSGPGDLVLTDLNSTTALANYTITGGVLVPVAKARVVEFFTFGGSTACEIRRIDAAVEDVS